METPGGLQRLTVLSTSSLLEQHPNPSKIPANCEQSTIARAPQSGPVSMQCCSIASAATRRLRLRLIISLSLVEAPAAASLACSCCQEGSRWPGTLTDCGALVARRHLPPLRSDSDNVAYALTARTVLSDGGNAEGTRSNDTLKLRHAQIERVFFSLFLFLERTY